VSDPHGTSSTRRIMPSLTNVGSPKATLLEIADSPPTSLRTNSVELVRRAKASVNMAFHRRMAYAATIIVALSVIGCKLTSVHIEISEYLIATVAAFAMVAPLPIYWHEKGRVAMRESALVIPWELLFAMVLPFPVLIAARLCLPLQDSILGRIDQALGVNVPTIVALAGRHRLGAIINGTYPLLQPLALVAALAPALSGKMKHAREFLISNVVAFAIGVPLFAVLPAVGPWYYYHLAPNSAQLYCWTQFQLLRSPGSFVFLSQGVGVVCFPSFHVVWAILSASALWAFRPIRVPVGLLSAMIVVSTLTTGWHYFADVLGGIALAMVSIAVARIYAKG